MVRIRVMARVTEPPSLFRVRALFSSAEAVSEPPRLPSHLAPRPSPVAARLVPILTLVNFWCPIFSSFDRSFVRSFVRSGDQGGVRVLRLRPAPGLLRVRQPEAPLPVRGDSLHLRQDGEAEDPAARAGGPGAPDTAVFAVDAPLGPVRGMQ